MNAQYLMFFVLKFFLIAIMTLWFNNADAYTYPSTYENYNIHYLLDQCTTKDASQVSKSLKKLQQYPNTAFDTKAKQKIKTILQSDPPHMDKWILLAGYLEMEIDVMNLQKIAYENKSTKQALKLALVRTGDEARLKNLMKNVKKIPIGDDFIYQIIPILIYVRQKAATDYLMEIILQDSEDCTPADAETSGTVNCAYRIIEALAPVVIDFPVEVDDFGDIITKDYEASLKKVRKWIRKNKASYELNKEIY